MWNQIRGLHHHEETQQEGGPENCIHPLAHIHIGFVKIHTYQNDAYLVFHIKINDDFCDTLFDALFISLDPKHDSIYKLEQRLVTMSVSLHTQAGLYSLIIQVLHQALALEIPMVTEKSRDFINFLYFVC